MVCPDRTHSASHTKHITAGQAIALIHNPPRITIHSIQDGHEEHSPSFIDQLSESSRLTGVWWFKDERQDVDSIPDIFKRGLDIVCSYVNTSGTHANRLFCEVRICSFSYQEPTPPGSSFRQLAGADVCIRRPFSTCWSQPDGYRATQLFSFQNASQMSKTSDLPEAIASWPTLPSDLLSASIQPDNAVPERQKSDDPKVNSILVVSDDAGHMHCFLDGSYPLGAIFIGARSTTASLWKDLNNPVLFVHQRSQMGGTTLHPTRVELPLLSMRIPRDLARISTTARELLWYTMRVLDEMHVAWLGSGTQIGAREPGIRWLKSLDDLQAQMGACMRVTAMFPLLWADTALAIADSATSLLDLTLLLLVGRSSEPVSDYIGSGEQMSERVGTLSTILQSHGIRIIYRDYKSGNPQ